LGSIGELLGQLRHADLPVPLMAMALTMMHPDAEKRLGLEKALGCSGWDGHNHKEFVGGVLEAAGYEL